MVIQAAAALWGNGRAVGVEGRRGGLVGGYCHGLRYEGTGRG